MRRANLELFNLLFKDYKNKQQEMQEKLEGLENRYNHMIEKKAESKYILKYTHVLDELCK